MNSLWRAYDAFARARPIPNALMTGALVGGVCSDCTAQYMENCDRPWDPRRTFAMSVWAATCSALPSQAFVWFVNKRFGHLGSRGAVLSTVVDLGIYAPFYNVPVYYLCTGLIRGQTPSEAFATLQKKYAETLQTIWSVMCPGLLIAYGILPLQHRVGWMMSIGYLYKTAISVIANR